MKHSNTKQVRYAYEVYLKSTDYELSHVYKTFSIDKENIYKSVKRFCYVLDGYRFRIIGATIQTFSCGFLFKHPQSKKEAFCYITKHGKRFVYLDEIEKRTV